MSIVRFAASLSTLCAVGALGLGLSISPAAYAQNPGYSVSEDGGAPPQAGDPNAPAPPDNSTAGPVRMARFSYVKGNVTWRADDSMDWAAAPDNLPLKQGAQIWVANGGRAEIQFDDGSYLRLGGGAIATLSVLFSDAQGEFTQIKLSNGLAMLKISHGLSVYEVDTPLVSAKADGPARMRFGVGDGVEIGVLGGTVAVEGAQGKVTLTRGNFLSLRDANSPLQIVGLPDADSWEQWNDARDQMLDGSTDSLLRHQVPESVALVAGDLDSYGTWRVDPVYGEVWLPRVVDPAWRPYFAGHWVWVNPFGWTWCSDEPWGWAPYHYGTWVHQVYGWAWRPGPVTQYWSPAVVHFTEYNGSVAWCALAPSEVVYPSSIAIGFRGGNWAAFFSIGAAGCYYPGGQGVCVSRAFSTVIVNRTRYVTASNAGREPAFGFAVNNNGYMAGRQFVPLNARAAGGVVVSTSAAFGGRGSYTPATAGAVVMFTQGRAITAPPAGAAPVAGPPMIKPTSAALTPSRSYLRSASESAQFTNRQVYVPKGNPLANRPTTGTGLGGSNQVRSIPQRAGTGGQGGIASAPRSQGGNPAADAAEAARHALGRDSGGSGYTGRQGSTGNPGGTPPGGQNGWPGRGPTGNPPPAGQGNGGGHPNGGNGGGTTGGGQGNGGGHPSGGQGNGGQGNGGKSGGGQGGSQGGGQNTGGQKGNSGSNTGGQDTGKKGQ